MGAQGIDFGKVMGRVLGECPGMLARHHLIGMSPGLRDGRAPEGFLGPDWGADAPG